MAYFVYILQSKQDGSFYIGQTANLEDRIRRHNQGRNLYTKGKAPWTLIYQESFVSRAEATKREREIKARKDRDYVAQLVRTSR
jgi:putative endonuclease